MIPSNQKLIAVVGPTASGKTGLAVAIAQRFDGEVISADSRQVYKGLDIGTEKATSAEMQGVPHYCIDIASPRRACGVERWRRCALRAMHQIQKHHKLAVVAGGTGQYVDALVYGTDFPATPPNAVLRRMLEKKSKVELFEQLAELDPVRATSIEQENPRRLIRAIEVATALGRVPVLKKPEPQYDVTWIGIYPGLETLEKRIATRLDATLIKGLVAETRSIRENLGLSWKRIHELGLEYRAAGMYLRGELSKDDMRSTMLRELRRYAKRQLTWLKRNDNIHWFTTAAKALAYLEKSYRENVH